MTGVFAILSLLAIAPGDYRMPVIEVRGERLTVDEVIARAGAVEEAAARSGVPLRFTCHVRFVAIYGDTLDPRCEREVVDRVSRVEEGPGPGTSRSVQLRERSEKWKGDSLVESRSDEIAKDRFTPQIEAIRRIPLALRRGLYRYAIIERRKLPEGSLIHIAYRPRRAFASLPEGEAWIDTKDYVVLWQTGSQARNVPYPMLLRSIDSFSIRRSRYGPVWIEDAMVMRLTLRRAPGAPRRIQLSIRLRDVAVGGEEVRPDPGATTGCTTAPAPPSEEAWIDSLRADDRARGDPLLWRPIPLDDMRISGLGDSILLSMAGSRRPGPYGWRPVLRYGHAERLFGGCRVSIGRGPDDPTALDLDGGCASALGRMTGRARIEIASGGGGGLNVGAWASGESGVRLFDPVLPGLDFVDAVAFGVDTHDAFFRRGVEGGIYLRIGRGIRVSCSARADRDRAIPSRPLWSLFGGRARAPVFRAIDPGETRAAACELRLRGARVPWLAVSVRAETGRAAPAGSRRVGMRELVGTVAARPLLPGGRRLVVRGVGMTGAPGVPLQDRLYLGGRTSLRGYDKGALSGANGYHVGGELFLNRDIVGWLPWIPDRGLGLEAFLAGDHGRILSVRSVRSARAGEQSGGLTSAGIGFACPLGIPGLSRILIGLHRSLAGRDRELRVRLEAEPGEGEGGEDGW